MSQVVVNVTKGQKVDLTKTNPGLSAVKIGLGWDAGDNYDLDVFSIPTKAGQVCPDSADAICFFGNKSALGGALTVSEDNRTGADDASAPKGPDGRSHDETLCMDFTKLPTDVDAVFVGVNIYNAGSKKFGNVRNAFAAIYETDPKVEIIRYDLEEDQSSATGVWVGKFYKHNGEWKFQALNIAQSGSVNDFLSHIPQA